MFNLISTGFYLLPFNQGGGGGSGIQELRSVGGTIGITDPTGPITNIELPQSVATDADVTFDTLTLTGIVSAIGTSTFSRSTAGFSTSIRNSATGVPSALQILSNETPAILNNAPYGTVFFSGTSALGTYGSGVALYALAAENWNLTSNGSKFEILITPNGSTIPALAATFGQDKSLAMVGNISAPLFTGAVTGAASGNTTYTANQYGVVVSGAANAMGVIAPVASVTQLLVSGGVAANPSWQSLTNAMLPSTSQATNGNFNVSVGLSGWVIPGVAPTITTHFERQGNMMFVQITIIPAGGIDTVAATAVTSTITGLPIASGVLASGVSVSDLTTSVGIGNGIVRASSTVIQMPSIGATTDTLIISGSYSLV